MIVSYEPSLIFYHRIDNVSHGNSFYQWQDKIYRISCDRSVKVIVGWWRTPIPKNTPYWTYYVNNNLHKWVFLVHQTNFNSRNLSNVAFYYRAHDQSQSSVNKRNVKRIRETGNAFERGFDWNIWHTFH